MLKSGIVNPLLLNLLARVRHTNTIVIADRGFPSWPLIECVDLSLSNDIPTVAQVLAALQAQWEFKGVWMAKEFRDRATPSSLAQLGQMLKVSEITFEPHADLKLRVERATGIIRTADSTPYANMILESA